MPHNDEKPSIDNMFAEMAVSDAAELMFGDKSKVTQRYNPSLILSNRGFYVLDKMRRDDQIKAAMAFKKNSVLATGWEVVSPEGMPKDWELTEFVEQNLNHMKGTFERRILDALTALDYGFSITEKVFAPSDERIYLKSIKTKKPHDFTFSTDAYGNLTELDQMGYKLPIDKFIIYSYDMEFDNLYGNPDLDAAYRAWWTKDNAYRWFAMLLERMGIPPIFALYDAESYKGTALSELREVISNLQAATAASLPTYNDKDRGKSLEFWAPELANNIADVFIPAMDMLNRDIARAILMPGQIGATPDDGIGSYAKSKVQFDVFMLTIERIRKDIQEHVIQEQIVKPLIDLNYNTKEYPQFKFLPLTDDVRLDLLEVWTKLAGQGVVRKQTNDEDHIRNLLQFPEADEDLANEENEQSENGEAGEPNSFARGSLSDRERKYEFEFNRDKNAYEKKVDFAQIAKTLDRHEENLALMLRNIIKEEEEYLTKQLRKRNPDLNSLSFRKSFKGKLEKAVKTEMLDAAKSGRNEILSIKKFKADIGYITSLAEKWIASRATDISGVLSNKLQDEIRIIISNAIRSGLPLNEVILRIQDALLPYVGDPNVLEDDGIIEPFRVETIARTNMATAYNQGKLVAIRDPDVADFIHGVEYSAIMDSRTTEICRHLDGRVFKVDDPALDRLTPPNHYNCRSILVQILIDEPIKKEDFLNERDKGKAFDLAGKGFV